MKHFFLTSAFLIVASFGAMIGQTSTKPTSTEMNASFGVKANANLSNFVLRNSLGVSSDMKLGFSPGFFMKFENDRFAVQSELLLIHRSSSLRLLILNTDYKYWGLELPVYFLGQVKTNSGKFFVGAGPYVGYGLDATISLGNFDLYNDFDVDIFNIFKFEGTFMKRWDFGLGAIAGYELDNGVIINVGYQAGLVDLQHAAPNIFKMKNQTISFGLGYKF